MALKRFTKTRFLEEIGREQIIKLLASFSSAFVAANVAMPPADLADKEYYAALAKTFLGQKGLPEAFIETLYAIELMANEIGRDRLRKAVEQSGTKVEASGDSTHAEFALATFLAAPELFGKKHEEMFISRLCSFDHYVSRERRTDFSSDDEKIGRIKNDVDEWLAENREGEERVTEIEAYELDGEAFYLIRRADTTSRLPVVENSSVVVKYLRLARDLVVVYNRERDELRVHGKGSEIKMICRVFGVRFFGDPDHFSVRKSFSLKPLREDEKEALVVIPGDGIDRIVLREVEVRTNDTFDAVLTLKAKDIFALADATGNSAIPSGDLLRAAFDVYFTGQKKPRTIHLKEGNRLRVARYCDAAAIQRWLEKTGFRTIEEPGVNRIMALNERVLGNN